VKILFDQGTPVPLRRELPGHDIVTAYERGWQARQNGDLLNAAEAGGFEAIITTDKNLRYQQNFSKRQLAILVLMTTDWRLIRLHTGYVAQATNALTPGTYVELPFPPL
jgi:hypothetical protein